MSPRAQKWTLATVLLALAALFAVWFAHDRHWLASQLVFTAPPLLLALGVVTGRGKAMFWAGVLALFWFSHGVMSAWSHPETAHFAWLELLLALAVIGVSSAPGLRRRFSKR
ncbi:MAG: rane protein [Stenotrophomonas rhizophila]|jgi:uncharacterized membrane protein|uniref:Membrane protein n=1 Tax=Stenotrophomonas rhizophila TaxID=216778 RepID=A0AAP5ALN4_9GAMM|nr:MULTISPECIES: DUF2069 domain-containing protein [Stenotrophomonas]MDF2819382.1 rane protein [Stenotrophomonas rhizophila]MDQ1063753.1 putative membrane protein [Stenotrophomonas sp. SORGH_AS_0282]MDQ1109738.1 putative membrane protein [Stenotrophomonas rhizophila]MDQ1187880.1 putative membrane protein [Stenotrophomonas sp. SORGH_AS_0282]PAK89039.1 hypothetical protein B8X02_18140 [Stenotrophomonas rhizophila]